MMRSGYSRTGPRVVDTAGTLPVSVCTNSAASIMVTSGTLNIWRVAGTSAKPGKPIPLVVAPR